jgi:hypothetical protein
MVRKRIFPSKEFYIFFLVKGFCLHRLVSVSSQSSIWWFKSPIDNLRDKFTELNHSRQTAVLVILILIIIILVIAFVSISIRFLISLRVPIPHRDTEYVRLENLDDDTISNGHRSDETTIPLTQIEQS